MPRSTNNMLVDAAFEQVRKDTDTKLSRISSAVPLVFGAPDTTLVAADRYLRPFATQTAVTSTEQFMPVYRGGVLQAFVVRIVTIGAAAADRKLELVVRVNGKDTNMRAYFTCPKFTGILRATGKVLVKTDDLISVVLRKSGALTTACDLGPLYMEITPA